MRRAFTAVEMLMVLLVVGILIAAIVPVVRLVQRAAEKRRAGADADALVQAVMRYRQVYGIWPLDAANTNGGLFVAGTTTGAAPFAAVCPELQADIDQAEILAALAPDSPANPRRQLFLTVATNALPGGRLADPWGQPYLLVMDARRTAFVLGDLAFSNLDAFAISAGPPSAAVTVSNWIFSAGVKP
jgi:prepilin-type N-terminal cleavage/methylation domain-containing protein